MWAQQTNAQRELFGEDLKEDILKRGCVNCDNGCTHQRPVCRRCDVRPSSIWWCASFREYLFYDELKSMQRGMQCWAEHLMVAVFCVCPLVLECVYVFACMCERQSLDICLSTYICMNLNWFKHVYVIYVYILYLCMYVHVWGQACLGKHSINPAFYVCAV